MVRYEICEIDKKALNACWAIDGGRIFIHFTSGLTELYGLRAKVDEMIDELENAKKEQDKKHKLSLRAQRARKRK